MPKTTAPDHRLLLLLLFFFFFFISLVLANARPDCRMRLSIATKHDRSANASPRDERRSSMRFFFCIAHFVVVFFFFFFFFFFFSFFLVQLPFHASSVYRIANVVKS